MITQDLQRIQNHPRRLTAATALTLVLTRDARSQVLETFVQSLETHWPALDIERRSADDDSLPFMELGDGFRFQGLPAESKLPPFLDVLAAELAPPEEKYRELLNRMTLSDELRLYIAAPCPFCPRAVRQWAALAWAGPNMRVRVVDGTLFPEDVARDGIQAVPTLVVDQEWRWSGNIPVEDVLRQLVDRDPSQLSAAALEGLLKEGQAASLAVAMQRHGTIFPAFVDLLTHPKWPIRLGAMVAMEALIESDQALSKTVVPLVVDRFIRLDEQAKGDALYILGEAGDHETLALLRALPLDGAGAELHQAAREAAETIAARIAAAKGE
jgi:hypothetical protein